MLKLYLDSFYGLNESISLHKASSMMSLYCQDQLVAVERCSIPPLAAINVLSADASNHTKSLSQVRDHEMRFRCTEH